MEVIVTSLHTETAMPPADPCQRGSSRRIDDRGTVSALRRRAHPHAPRRALRRRRLVRAAIGRGPPRGVPGVLNALPPHATDVVGHAGFFKRFLGEDQKMKNLKARGRPPSARFGTLSFFTLTSCRKDRVDGVRTRDRC